MGISRDSRHKRRKTGAKVAAWRNKRKFELGRQGANTKLEKKRIKDIRVRGGHIKRRALRLDSGTYSWPSQATSMKSRILDVIYNASNNELVRTKTLVKGAIVQIDATPYRQFYEQRYGVRPGKKRGGEETAEVSKKVANRQRARLLVAGNMEKNLDEQFTFGRLYAKITSRPGQSGRADGYILEGKELEFYKKKALHKK